MKTIYQQTVAFLSRNTRVTMLACISVFLSSQLQASNYTITSTSDPGANSGNTSTLRGAMEAANNQSNQTHTITLASGATYNLSAGQLTFGANGGSLTISVASGGTATINMTNNSSADRIFNINPNVGSGVNFTISNCTLSNGKLNTDGYGGGAICHGGPSCSLTVTNCTFTSNTMTGASGSVEGGAICYAYGGNLSVNQCTFNNNSSLGGGGAITFKAYSVSGVYPNSSISVTNSTFNSNSATNFGGAISITSTLPGSGSPTLSVTITGNNFTNNSTTAGGSNGGALALTNSISASNTYLVNYNRFTGNTAVSNGPALWMTDAIGKVDATNNWWGCNSLPDASSTCANKAIRASGSSAGTLTIAPYLVARTSISSDSLCTGSSGNTSTVTVSFATNSNNQNVAANLGALNGKSVSFNVANTALGTVSPTSATFSSGVATTTFTTAGTTTGVAVLRAGFDNIPSTDQGLAKDSLYIKAGAAISTGPGDITPCVGTNPTLSVTATGTNVTYQWRKGTTNLANGATGNGSTISGATAATLTISNIAAADAANNYNVVVTNSCGSATSGNASVTVNTPPVINAGGQPVSVTPCSGTAATFTVTPSSGSTPFAYQWYKGTTALSNGATGTGSTISGATTATLTITNVGASDNATNYNVKVMNTCNASGVQSNNASLTLITLPTPAAPNSPTVCAGDTAKFYASATGTPPFTYQWRKGTTNLVNGPTGNGSTIIGATKDTLWIINARPADAASTYNYVVNNGCVTSAFSSSGTLTVNSAPVITTEPVHDTACSGTTSSFTVAASGSGTITYQWRKGNTNLVNGATGNGSTISGATTATLSISSTALADSGSNYNVIVSTTCGKDTSVNVMLKVNGAPVITTGPQAFAGCQGNAATFSVTASSSTTPVTYQWYKGATPLADGFTGNGSVISGATAATMTLLYATTFDNAANYNVKVTNACNTTTSGNASLTITAATTPATTTSGTATITTNNPILYNGSCGIITTLVPFGASPISGSVTATVTIDGTVPTYNGRAYVQRHYDIVPAVNAATATATTTLYFTQAEFDAFNIAPGVSRFLPTGPNDSAGKANIRIYQYHGTGTNPGNYTGARETIDPADANITYDASTARWRIIFSVNGFSGFYLSNPSFVGLPLDLLSFSGTVKGNSKLLQWSTTNEKNTDYFGLERSENGLSFTTIAKIATTGNNRPDVNQYSYVDATGSAPVYYYRLKMVDIGGDFKYSTTLSINTGDLNGFNVNVSPNPFRDQLDMMISADNETSVNVVLTDISSHIVMQKTMPVVKGVNSLQLGQLNGLAKGIYFLRISNDKMTETIKVIKAE